MYVTYVISCCRFILLPHWCHRTAVSMAHTCSHPQRVRDVRRGLCEWDTVHDICPGGRVCECCDTRALLRVNTLGRADWDPVHVVYDPSPCLFHDQPQVLLYVPYYLLATAINPTKKTGQRLDLSLHNVTKLPCLVYPPRSDTTWVIFQGNDALKWVDTCLGDSWVNQNKCQATEHRHRQVKFERVQRITKRL